MREAHRKKHRKERHKKERYTKKMTDQELCDEIMRDVCEELRMPFKSVEEIAREEGDDDYFIRVVIAIRKRGRFLVANDDENYDRIIAKAALAGGKLAPKLAVLLERRKRGWGARVFERACVLEDEDSKTKALKEGIEFLKGQFPKEEKSEKND